MLKNYFKVAVRNMIKRKGYTLLNILGLAIGMAVCLVIILFVAGELSFDNFNVNKDRIYRVALERRYPGRSTSYAIIPLSIGDAMHKEFPEIQQSVRLFNFQQQQGVFIRIDDKVFIEKNVLFTDSNFFSVFTLPLLQGNPDKALILPNSIVLNETTAKKYFGSVTNAMGKTIQMDDAASIITGVCKDLPKNAHFSFDFLASTSSLGNFINTPNYINFSAYTYLLLSPVADAIALEAKFPQVIEKYVAGDIEKNFGISFKDFQAEGNGYHYFLQQLSDIHLTSNLESELSANGSIKITYAFIIIAFFILFLACINFINLSTARSLDRAKEVGIRKTFGSERRELIWQFLFESVIISFIGVLVALLLAVIAVPFFNQLFGTHLNLSVLLLPFSILIFFSMTLLVGILSGLYPAFVLSSFEPIIVLKGKFSFNPKGRFIRNSLVVFQFAISVILIIATLIVNRQMQYMLSDQLGFKKDHVIILNRTDLLNQQIESFKNDLYKIPGVESVSSATALPGEQNFFGLSIQSLGSKKMLTGRGLIVDDQYLSALDIPIVKGRFFSKDLATDSLSVVLNQKAAEEFGFTDPIGKQVITPDGFFSLPDGTPQTLTVVGVVKDFHFQSLHQMITPLIFINSSKFQNVMPVAAVRIQSSQFKSTLTGIERTWDHYLPQHPFQISFLDQQLTNLYESEETMQDLFVIFSGLAIFIACMGLLGLIMYATQKRAREIGIRKVLGASIGSIVALLSKDFLRLVLIAAIIAFPIAWLGMNKWLQDFAYRVTISWWIFGTAMLAALLLTLITVSFQAIKAAIANPVKSLRTE
ncbi:MAG: ABC transporter permease [Chitinophagales bacterium]